MKPLEVWIAVSVAGYPSPFIGWAYTRKDLIQQYRERGRDLEDEGYKAVKAVIIVNAIKEP